jgi:transposase InsO family protein
VRRKREEVVRYEWPCPGDLLHMDTARYARFERPGHRVTGDRSQRSRNWMAPETRVGYDFAHAIVDDHTRLAYVELHPDEKALTVTRFVERALEWFAGRGIEARRLMSDNALTYVRNRSLRELLQARQIKHLTTQPYRPRTNGKVERFHQTMAREWAYGMPTAHTVIETRRCHTGSTTTTRPDPTRGSATGRRSAAFTTCRGRTARRGVGPGALGANGTRHAARIDHSHLEAVAVRVGVDSGGRELEARQRRVAAGAVRTVVG